MPPEAILSRGSVWLDSLPRPWRGPLAQVLLASAVLIGLTAGQWAEMARQWWTSSTYNHILLVPAILVWLVRLRWPELAKIRPAAFWPALAWVAAGLAAWSSGIAAGINLLSELGAVIVVQGAVATLLGPNATAGLIFPLGYMLFLVPFGEEIVWPMQLVTARMAIALTYLSGVPAALNGVFIATPIGVFEVAEACSGVKFLIAMVALGALVAHMGFRTPRRRAAFMAACCVVPVLANGVRAWGTIYIAQSKGVPFAAGFDHIVYGWIFFAIVMTVLLGLSWRFFDRAADDRLVDIEAIENSPRLRRLERFSFEGWHGLAAIVLAAGLADFWGAALARPLVDGLLAATGLRP